MESTRDICRDVPGAYLMFVLNGDVLTKDNGTPVLISLKQSNVCEAVKYTLSKMGVAFRGSKLTASPLAATFEYAIESSEEPGVLKTTKAGSKGFSWQPRKVNFGQLIIKHKHKAGAIGATLASTVAAAGIAYAATRKTKPAYVAPVVTASTATTPTVPPIPHTTTAP